MYQLYLPNKKKLILNSFIIFLSLAITNDTIAQKFISKSHPLVPVTDVIKSPAKSVQIVTGKKNTAAIIHKSTTVQSLLGADIYVNDIVDAGDVYTSNAGDDINGDGSASAPFATISYAISQASSGNTIYIDAGTYVENIFIDKQLILKGSNFGTSPNAARVAESIITTPVSDPNPNTGVGIIYLDAAASGSTIDGFSIDGDNPALTSGVTINGADIDAVEAIASYEGMTDLSISNNIIKNFSYSGIDLYNYNNSGAATSGNTVTSNTIDNITDGVYGIGVLIYNNCYTDITNNTISRIRVGIQTGNFYQADPGNSHAIQNNTIQTIRRGIWHNLAYNAAANFVIANNGVTLSPGSLNSDGIMISSLLINAGATVTGNNITGTRIGYNLWNNPTSNTITITGGTVSNCTLGVFANNFDGYASDAATSSYIISGIQFTGGDTAIYVKDNTLNSNGASVFLQLTGNSAISGSTAAIGIVGGDAHFSFTGAIPASISSTSYILDQVSNGVNSPSDAIDATTVLFNGNTGASQSNANLFAIEDKIKHKTDNIALPFVTVKSNNDYITQLSGSIQRGIDIASDGWTVNVNSGTFNESILVNKQVSVKGAQNGILAKSRAGGESVVDPNTAASQGFKIVTDNVSIDGFTITNSAAYPPSSTERSGVITIEKAGAGNFTGIVVKNNIITRQFKAVNLNYTNNFEISNNWLHGESDPYNYGCTWVSSYGTSSSNGLISNNDLDGYSSAIEIQGNASQPVSNITISENRSAGSQYVLFGLQNSTVYRNAALNVTTGSHVFIGGGCSNDIFTENFFDNGVSNGISISNGFGAGINSALTINNNSITGHNGTGFFDIRVAAGGYTGTLNAECNWLGTANGTAIAPHISGTVDFTPWLSNGTDNAPSTAGFQPVPGSCNGIPLLASVTTVTNVLCKNAATGAIDIAVSDGSGNYTYSWTNGATTQDLNAVIAGTYSVTITDAFGQSVTLSAIQITQPPAILTASAVQNAAITCNGGSTTVTVSAAGGVLPYTGTGNFTASAGINNYTITDGNGCTAPAGVNISQPSAIVVNTTSGTIQCNGGSTTVTVTATGGTAGYTGTGNFTVSAGTYTYAVTDANGCTGSKTVTINQPSPIIVNTTAGIIACGGNRTTAIISASGGTPPYRYALNGSRLKPNNTFSNLKAGSYVATVADANGCVGTQYFTITQPTALKLTVVQKVDVSCNGGSNGLIQVTGTGGTAPYQYKIGNGAYSSTNTFTNLSAGTYNVSVKDAAGCITSKSIRIRNGSGSCSSIIAPGSFSKSGVLDNELIVKVMPNPSTSVFTLILQSRSKVDIELIVTDMYGRKVYQAKGSTTQQYVFGNNFASGIYFVKIIQGNKIQTIKLVKGKG